MKTTLLAILPTAKEAVEQAHVRTRVRVVVWMDEDPKNPGWAVAASWDEGYGWEFDFSEGVDVDDDANLQTVIDAALDGVKDIPAAAKDARNYSRDHDGYTFIGAA